MRRLALRKRSVLQNEAALSRTLKKLNADACAGVFLGVFVCVCGMQTTARARFGRHVLKLIILHAVRQTRELENMH